MPVACAGELATLWNITGWPEGETKKSAQCCLEAWIKERGGVGLQEHQVIIEQVRLFFEQHAESRFSDWNNSKSVPTRDRVGYKRIVDGEIQFLVFPQSFKREICDNSRSKLRLVTEVCEKAGMLIRGKGNRRQTTIRLPHTGQPSSVYLFNSSVLSETVEAGRG